MKAKFDEDFKKRAVKMSYARGRSLQDVADELGICVKNLYCWRKIYTRRGNKTKNFVLGQERRALLRERRKLLAKIDRLKRASDYSSKKPRKPAAILE